MVICRFVCVFQVTYRTLIHGDRSEVCPLCTENVRIFYVKYIVK